MRIAWRTRVMSLREGEKAYLKDELISFPEPKKTKPEPKLKPRTLEEEAAVARARWMGATGWREEEKPQGRKK